MCLYVSPVSQYRTHLLRSRQSLLPLATSLKACRSRTAVESGHTHTYIHIHTHTDIRHTHIHTQTYTHIHIHTHIYTHKQKYDYLTDNSTVRGDRRHGFVLLPCVPHGNAKAAINVRSICYTRAQHTCATRAKHQMCPEQPDLIEFVRVALVLVRGKVVHGSPEHVIQRCARRRVQDHFIYVCIKHISFLRACVCVCVRVCLHTIRAHGS